MDIWEHRVEYPCGSPPSGGINAGIQSLQHPLIVILHPWCDLEQDYKKRLEKGAINRQPENYTDEIPNTVPQVLCCEAYDIAHVKASLNARLMDQVLQNDHKRYHYFNEARIRGKDESIPAMIIDFKKIVAISCVSLYEAIRISQVRRLAIVPDVYVHDLINRFYAFMSRVGLPEVPPSNQTLPDIC